jgi:pimeloyl-ACP methyl ester carboxylesterase
MPPDPSIARRAWSTTFTSRDGVVLRGDSAGPDDAPLVVLMHGGGQTRHSWSGAMKALLAKGYRVVNFDGRGHGDSDWSPIGAYGLDDRVDDLAAVLGPRPGPFTLVGASLGGATALCAVARGLEPAAVVLVDIVPHPEARGIDRIVSFMGGHPEGFATIEDAAAAVAAYNPDRPAPADTSGLMRNLKRGADGRLHWHWDPRILSRRPEDHHVRVQRAAQALGEPSAPPVLLVRGLRSDVVSDAGIERFRRLAPGLEVVDVAAAGHMVAGDRNDAFNAGVLNFLDRRMPAGRPS